MNTCRANAPVHEFAPCFLLTASGTRARTTTSSLLTPSRTHQPWPSMLNLVAYLPLALYCLLPDAGACRRVVHQRQLRIRSCAEPPLPPAKPSDSERAAEPEERTYSDDWSGAGRFADEDPLPLSFWLLGPNPRRTLLPALLIPLLVGPATNLWGSGSLLLSLAPEAARKQRLDTFYPVSNRKGYPYDKGYLDYSAGSTRYYDEDGRYEFRYPASYVRDRAVYLRNVDAAYQRRMMATTGLPGSSTAKPRGPEVAFGPADGTGTRDENLSVVVAAIERGFTLRGVLGSPTEAAERLLRETIGRQAHARPPSTPSPTTPRAQRPPTPLRSRPWWSRPSDVRIYAYTRRPWWSRPRFSVQASAPPPAAASLSTSSSTGSTMSTRSSRPRTPCVSSAPAAIRCTPSPPECRRRYGRRMPSSCVRPPRASSCTDAIRKRERRGTGRVRGTAKATGGLYLYAVEVWKSVHSIPSLGVTRMVDGVRVSL